MTDARLITSSPATAAGSPGTTKPGRPVASATNIAAATQGQRFVDDHVLEPGDGEAGENAGERRPPDCAQEPPDEPGELLRAPAHQT